MLSLSIALVRSSTLYNVFKRVRYRTKRTKVNHLLTKTSKIYLQFSQIISKKASAQKLSITGVRTKKLLKFKT